MFQSTQICREDRLLRRISTPSRIPHPGLTTSFRHGLQSWASDLVHPTENLGTLRNRWAAMRAEDPDHAGSHPLAESQRLSLVGDTTEDYMRLASPSVLQMICKRISSATFTTQAKCSYIASYLLVPLDLYDGCNLLHTELYVTNHSTEKSRFCRHLPFPPKGCKSSSSLENLAVSCSFSLVSNHLGYGAERVLRNLLK